MEMCFATIIIIINTSNTTEFDLDTREVKDGVLNHAFRANSITQVVNSQNGNCNNKVMNH